MCLYNHWFVTCSLRKLLVLCSVWNNQTQQSFDSNFPFPPKRTWNWQFSDSDGFLKPEPVVIKEIDTHPTLLRTLGPYDTFANPWSKARNTTSMTAPTEEKLTTSTLWSSTLLTHVGGGERKRESNWPPFWEMWTHQQRNCLQFAPAQWERTHPFSVLQKFRQPGLRNLHNWDPVLSSHTVKKKKAKENLRDKSHYCTAQSPKGEAEINFLLPYLCAENHCHYYGLNPSSYLD